jgi:hypothetical protein
MYICQEAFYSLDKDQQVQWKKEMGEIEKIRKNNDIKIYFRTKYEDHFNHQENPICFNDFEEEWYIDNITTSEEDDMRPHDLCR